MSLNVLNANLSFYSKTFLNAMYDTNTGTSIVLCRNLQNEKNQIEFFLFLQYPSVLFRTAMVVSLGIIAIINTVLFDDVKAIEIR